MLTLVFRILIYYSYNMSVLFSAYLKYTLKSSNCNVDLIVIFLFFD